MQKGETARRWAEKQEDAARMTPHDARIAVRSLVCEAYRFHSKASSCANILKPRFFAQLQAVDALLASNHAPVTVLAAIHDAYIWDAPWEDNGSAHTRMQTKGSACCSHRSRKGSSFLREKMGCGVVMGRRMRRYDSSKRVCAFFPPFVSFFFSFSIFCLYLWGLGVLLFVCFFV